MFAFDSEKRDRIFAILGFFKPAVDYIAANRLVFAALLYSLLLHLAECVCCFAKGLGNSLGNPFLQGLWGWLALFGLCLLAGGRAAKILLTALLFLQTLESSVSIFLCLLFALPLRADAISVLAASSPAEVREFLRSFYSWKIFAATLAVIGIFAAALYAVWKPKLKRTWMLYAICGILILPQLINTVRFTVKGDYEDIYDENSLVLLAVHLKTFSDDMRKWDDLEKHPELPREIECRNGGEPLLAVVVIGESATRFHHSIYGYPRPTDPVLGAKANLYVFTDVISGYAHTVRSFLYMLTAREQGAPDCRYTLFDVFKKAGFDIYLYSNQNRWGKYDSPISMLTAHADRRFFLQERFPGSYDDRLVDEFRKVALDRNRSDLVFFHLIGSHNSFDQRSPKERKVFHAGNRPIAPCKVDDWNELDEYDNSIRFTDHVLGKVIDMIDADPRPAFMLYCSDHGECPERFFSSPRSGMSKVPECYEVPFVFYANAAYRKKFPEILTAIRANLDKPFVTDRLMYPVFSAARITFADFPHEKDLFSPAFVPRVPRHLGENPEIYRTRRNPYLAGKGGEGSQLPPTGAPGAGK